MKYLITGGAGFIGIKLAEKLLKNNKCLIILETSENSPAIKFLLSMQFKIIRNNLLTSDIMLTNNY